jgi:hypothetical protein
MSQRLKNTKSFPDNKDNAVVSFYGSWWKVEFSS